METLTIKTITCPVCNGDCSKESIYLNYKWYFPCEFCKSTGEVHYVFDIGYHQMMSAYHKYMAEHIQVPSITVSLINK